MAAVLLHASGIAALKSALSPLYPHIKSSHLSEALASALRFRTSRSLQSAIKDAALAPQIRPLDDERFVARLDKLGYPRQPFPRFDGAIGRAVDTGDVEHVYPDDALLGIGWEQGELYSVCVQLQGLGRALPPYLSLSSLDARLTEAGLKTNEFVTIRLQDLARVQRSVEPHDEEEPRAPVNAGDDFTGIVSFRADAPDDFESLCRILDIRFPGAWRRTSPAVGEEIELSITAPLHIAALHAAMKQVDDGHIMVETLRAMPLHRNTLERRYSFARPRDWATFDDEDLVGDDDA